MLGGPCGTGCDVVRFPVHSVWNSGDVSENPKIVKLFGDLKQEIHVISRSKRFCHLDFSVRI